MIQVSKPSLGKEEVQAVAEVFKTGWLGLGSKVKEFEDRVVEFLGEPSRKVLAVNTGTTALHLALDALGIKEGDEVIAPSLTFIASIQVITQTEATPVFCDIEPDTLNIDIDDVKRKITPATKVIIPVHYRGEPCNMDELNAIAQKYKLRIIEDAAHAFGSKYKGRKIGSFGDIACLSFDPIKNITCGEGGAVVTSDSKLMEVMFQKRILGIDKDGWSRYRNERSWFYDVLTQGYRYHMSNINAAIGIEQLKKFELFTKRKKEIMERYDKEFANIEEIELLKTSPETILFAYIIKVKTCREEMMEYLNNNGVGAGIHYIPCHEFTFCKKYKTELPNTEKIYKQILTLPLYYDMTDSDVGKVVDTVKSFFVKG